MKLRKAGAVAVAAAVFPKGTSSANISNEDLQLVVELLNNRPRKRLNYLTPLEVLEKNLVILLHLY